LNQRFHIPSNEELKIYKIYNGLSCDSCDGRLVKACVSCIIGRSFSGPVKSYTMLQMVLLRFNILSIVYVVAELVLALAHLFIKVRRPGDSEVTFPVFESNCHLVTCYY